MLRRIPTVLLVAPALGLIAFATFSTMQATAKPADDRAQSQVAQTQIGRGKQLYLTSCASCHGVDGSGTNQGPPLIGVGAASADFMLTTGRMPLTDPSAEAVRKPP